MTIRDWLIYGKHPHQSLTLTTDLGIGTVVTSPEAVTWMTKVADAVEYGEEKGADAVEAAKSAVERRLCPSSEGNSIGKALFEDVYVRGRWVGVRRPALPSAPAEAREVLAARAERVSGYATSVFQLALDPTADPALVEQLQGEATQFARDLAEAGLQAIREIEREYLGPRDGLVEYHERALAQARERRDEACGWIDWIRREVLRRACEAAGQGGNKRIDTPTGKVWIQRNPPAIEIDPTIADLPDFLPDDLVRTKTTREVDKEKALAAIEAGRSVPGCRRVQRDRVEVK